MQALRWFLLALLILHGAGLWWAPAGARLPIALEAARQLGVLITLVVAVTAVLEALTVAQRIRAFSALLTPLRPLGLAPERVGRMLAWALEDAQGLREQLQQARRSAATEAGERPAGGTEQAAGARPGALAQAIDRVATLCLEIERMPQPSAAAPEAAPGPAQPRRYWLATLPLLLLLGWVLGGGLHG